MAGQTSDDSMKHDNPNTGPAPVEAEPNAQREKTFEPANPPAAVTAEQQRMPEKTAQDKVGDEMGDAVDEVRKRL